MDELKLPRLLTDGAVLQKNKPVHVWGWDEPGLRVDCVLTAHYENGQVEEDVDYKAFCTVSDEGSFSAFLPAASLRFFRLLNPVCHLLLR